MGAEARSLGHGGIRMVARAAGVGEGTVSRGVAELDSGEEPLGRVRRPGGGRKRVADLDPGAAAGAAGAGRAGRAGRSDVAAAVDDEVDPHAGRGADPAGPPGLRGHRGGPAAGGGLQPAGQRQDHRGQAAPGPRRAVPLPQRAGQGLPGGRGPGDQRGHQEEGTGRRVQERRAAVAAARASRRGCTPTTSPTGSWARPSRTGSTTWPRTPAGSTSAPTTTPPRSPWNPSAAGGTATGAAPTRTPGRLLITADAGGSNGYRTRAWKAELAALAAGDRPGRSPCATSRPAPRSGTRSSTGCSPTSP